MKTLYLIKAAMTQSITVSLIEIVAIWLAISLLVIILYYLGTKARKEIAMRLKHWKRKRQMYELARRIEKLRRERLER